jgi:deoxyribodipyrimidine photo-lyase
MLSRTMTTPVTIFWHRRDLRLDDNAGLYHALRDNSAPVLPIFIFDRHILDALANRRDARVEFIFDALEALRTQLESMGSTLSVWYGMPEEVWPQILQQFEVRAVYTNHDFEPYALQRDAHVADLLKAHNIPFRTYKDHVIFEKNEVLKDDGKPYTVFSPYGRKWRTRLAAREVDVEMSDSAPTRISYFLQSYPNERYFDNFLKINNLSASWPTASQRVELDAMNFERAGIPFPSATVARSIIRNYDATRNFPALSGTSRLGVHFRFGTISIREKARHAQPLNDTYLNELIWRDFYAQILAHFPHVVGNPFRAQYDRIAWRDAPDEFERWCQGRTGYAIVDAGMRELNATGYMHNRVRMIVASFLSKHLLIDWRLGEAYFAEKLLDFDLASNSGGWQWAAGCGTDAAPYFRVFNPLEQTKKFDSEYKYIRQWVPEFGTPAYPKPIVEHAFARQRCLEVYKAALGGA